MRPTPHLRFLEQFGLRILQQWWTTSQYVPVEGNPDGCIGEWRDIELVQE